MGVSRESVGLWLYGLDPPPLTQYPDQWEVQGPAGLFTHGGKDGGLAYFIGLNVQNAADPLPLVAILAHELAHVRLFEQLAGTEDQLEAEIMTDLATVFLGLGLFTANSVILEAKGHNPWIEGPGRRWLGWGTWSRPSTPTRWPCLRGCAMRGTRIGLAIYAKM